MQNNGLCQETMNYLLGESKKPNHHWSKDFNGGYSKSERPASSIQNTKVKNSNIRGDVR